ncbi:hypothetical protein ABC345_20700 [Shouchella sp. 1P09AA]|uniref:hypothetical protein n=1 Tax=unclassified Shouchella TaxID=2893065 RepID=UPI0039A10B0D
MNAREAAAILHVSMTTISTYIKEGLLVPENLDSWHIEGQYVIPEEQVYELRARLYPGGLSTKEAALEVGKGCKPYHILTAINKNQVNVNTSNVLNKTAYYVIEDTSFDQFKENFHRARQTQTKHFDSQRQLFRYQSHRHKKTGEVVRIMAIDKEEGYAVDSLGTKVSLLTLPIEYDPLTLYHIGKLNNRTGQVEFQFAKPTHIRSMTYTLIEQIAAQSGVRNYSITEEENKIVITCKPFLLRFEEGDNHYELIEHAKRGLVKGELQERKEDYFFASTDRKVTVTLGEEEYKKLSELTLNHNCTIEDLVRKNLMKDLFFKKE